MGNSRTINQKVNGNRRQQNIHRESTVPQKNIETMRVLSNVRLPNVDYHQWNADSSRNPGYFTEPIKLINGDQVKTYQGLIEETAPADIVTQALTAAINESAEQNQSDTIDVIDELTNISVSSGLMQVISSWNHDDEFDTQVKETLSSSSKENKEKSSTKKSRRPSSHKEESTKKKQRLPGDGKNKECSSELKQLLTSKCNVEYTQEKTKANPDGTLEIMKSTPIIIPEESQSMNDLFSQDTDMAVFKEAIHLKKKLLNEKEKVDQEYTQILEEVNNIKAEIEHLKGQLSIAEERLTKTSNSRNKLSKKVNWILKSL